MRAYRLAIQLLIAGLALCQSNFSAYAQSCPPNIDFETGSFAGWTCYTGAVFGNNGQNLISLSPSGGPMPGRHTMYSANPGDGLDAYGGFPVNCPNGSGHSIRLGNNLGGGEAEGISYEFTIPANENAYNVIYHYAVVFQDPNHLEFQQPRMEIEITNVTDNTTISCSSFTFYPYGSPLPGFNLSPNPGSETPVWYKDWSAVSINLDGNAGKTIRLFFKTADCTFRRHFGYAYIDVNSECSGTFLGATYCPDDTAINIVAPYGYQKYTWYNNTFTQNLGNQQILTLRPPPPAGTTVAVAVLPYNGYGCPDTLFARLEDTLSITANAGRDTLSCNHDPVPIGTIPKPGLVYQWFPAAGLSNPGIANPLAAPDITTTYIVTTNHDGGGCIVTDTVVVRAAVIDNSLQLIGSSTYCLGSDDAPVLRVQPTDSIQWFKDNIAITGANQTEYRVTESGVYRAMLFNRTGCSIGTVSQQMQVASIPVAGFIAGNNMKQCLVGNKFVFTNTSTNAVGAIEYNWIMGDGTIATTRDLTYSYSKSGTYTVKMIASSNSVCADSSSVIITVLQNAVSDFSVPPVCINLPFQPVNNTIDTGSSPVSYLWNLGNGQTSTMRIPAASIYRVPGNYSISLSVNTAECPLPLHTVTHTLLVDKPKPGIRYPVEFAVINIPLTLEARKLGVSVLWTPGTSLDTRTSYTPVFKGQVEQLYTIELKTNSGCITVDTQVVMTVKHVDIYVPTAFSPNNDGLNDFLRPILIGIKDVHYFKIFNRWGQLLFDTKGERPGWNGTFGGIKQASQVVVWMIEGVGVDGVIYRQKGTSTLVR